MLPHPAVFHFPWEIHLIKDGASVRTSGRLTSYKPQESKAILSTQQSSIWYQLTVQTTLVEPFQPILGAQYLVLGEIEKAEGVSGVVLCARALNCVDGVDLALMQQAILEQRYFFKERKPELNILEPLSPSNV
ncbi:TEN1 Protein telomeric pathways with STN1 -like protein Telomere length regulation protein [Triplophysa tibetana]|uniref:CST complex subunit TEN1 n=1 Tax=Triplophysa tibetana TaxID=1572043 RepID=A0A5A9NXP8_9TELE|nr:TEN1 Protein telomeric pathways with STN1 -like protein Telomere length regulation protein [Triplophysa tibetana]